MITHEGQLRLFQLITDALEKDVTCYAFGGTAMLFFGYKEDTKDIDLFFDTKEERSVFISALEKSNFRETSPMRVYIAEKLRDPNRPLMYGKEDVRFDLFANKIFHTVISPRMREDIFAIHEFKGKKTLTVKVLNTEIIVILKSVTERDKDLEDIVTIVKKDKDFNWQYFIDEVWWQHQHGDSWVLLDAEKMLQELKNYVFIPEKYLRQISGGKGKK